MTSFSVRDETDARVIVIDDSAALNDFRSNAFRELLYQAINDLEGRRVAFDLSAVDYLSSTGVATLVGAKRRLDRTGGHLVLFGGRPMVLDLLKLTNLTQFFKFAPDQASALELLRSLPTA